MNRFFIVILFLLNINQLATAQRYFTLSGYVKDSSGQAISSVSIRVRNDNLGTATDENGYFKIKLEEGYYEISITAIGYQDKSLNIPINKDVNVKVILTETYSNLNEIQISSKRKDPSWGIIQNVIANRSKINEGLLNYKCSGYIKASDILVVDSALLKKKEAKAKRMKFNQAPNIDSMEKAIKKPNEAIPNMNFAEIDLTKFWGGPNKIKEERDGVRIIGDKYALYFLSVTDGEFDFYKNQIELGRLTDVKYVSPFSPGANIMYKFKFLGSYYIGKQKIYRIKIQPRKVGNALFSGETEIYDSLWIIKSATFSINPNHIPMYNSFDIRQDYQINKQGFVFLESQIFTYTKKAALGIREGKTTVRYSNYETNLELKPKFFGNELSSAIDSAYERDSEWWIKQRKDTLTLKEEIFTHYRDSLQEVMTSKSYLDSIDKIYNRLTLLKVIWSGQGHINREKKLRVEYAPLFSTIQPGSVGGFRTAYFVQVNKKFENRQAITAIPFASYGFLNNDLKGGIFINHLYNPIRRSRYYVYAAREFTMINNADAYINMFRRSNYFDQRRLQVGNSTELVNGLFLTAYVTYSDRKDITNYKFSPLGDEIFKNNNEPVPFLSHKSAELKFIISYTPAQKYIREPKEKIILGSKYPTFTFVYNQGVKGLLGSDVDFNYVQASIVQTVNYGRIGIAKYNIGTGKFFNTKMLPLVDYKYQRRGDPFLFTSPLATFQLLPKTFPTFSWYLEAHYWHSFNGFLTSALPLLKKYNVNMSAGSSALWAFENNTQHIEIFYGVNKVFKLLRQTFKIGLYYANGYSNSGYYQGLKFSIENYNLRDNSWSF
jgi:hypothetical protein